MKSFISETENKYLKILYSYVRRLFAECFLPSHNHDHHLRIWHHASNLVNSLSSRNLFLNKEETENLILAVFFHDTGLTKTLKKEHGYESRKICTQFLDRNPGLFDHYPLEGLEAIAMHDDKDYTESCSLTGKPSVLGILSVCDDFDAFGAIGVLRYAEIYLLRETPEHLLPSQVIANLKKRYLHLAAQSWIPPDVLNDQKKRYLFALDFYKKLQRDQESGQLRDIKLIISTYMDSVYRSKTDIESYIQLLAETGNNSLIEFSKALKNDLHPFFINLPE